MSNVVHQESWRNRAFSAGEEGAPEQSDEVVLPAHDTETVNFHITRAKLHPGRFGKKYIEIYLST